MATDGGPTPRALSTSKSFECDQKGVQVAFGFFLTRLAQRVVMAVRINWTR